MIQTNTWPWSTYRLDNAQHRVDSHQHRLCNDQLWLDIWMTRGSKMYLPWQFLLGDGQPDPAAEDVSVVDRLGGPLPVLHYLQSLRLLSLHGVLQESQFLNLYKTWFNAWKGPKSRRTQMLTDLFLSVGLKYL